MTEKLKQTIKEEIMRLPKEGQESIGTIDWVKTTEEIGIKYNLTEEEVEDFQLETLLLLIGATDPEFYATNIENQVGLTKDQAKNITDESFQKIFTPIRNNLEENIKKNLKSKNPNWEQNLNFILSGGNYFAFIEERREQRPETSAPSINPPTLKDIKDNLLM